MTAGVANGEDAMAAGLPQVRPVGGEIGAEISGLDLSRDYPEATYDAVRRAWNDYGVIFFRDQHLTADQRERFARRFGEIQTVQELRKEPDQRRNVGESWHVDMTFRDDPPMGTMLFAEECPSRGGDTLFAGMAPAYDALSEGLKRTLVSLRAVHANVRKLGLGYENTSPPEPSVSEYDAAEGVLHPVVTRHPENGRDVLYVNAEYTTRFEGWTRRESLPLLRYLFEHGQQPEFCTRFRWQPGSIAFWDNRQVWHMAVNDYHGMRRVMNRYLFRGTRPIPAGAPMGGGNEPA
ncbi:MAG: TauD/TfdA dioxygenase family protein [Micromonosporaceae bacterium]